MHEGSLKALETVLRGEVPVYLATQNLIEFWNVCTRPVDRNGLFRHAVKRRLERLVQP